MRTVDIQEAYIEDNLTVIDVIPKQTQCPLRELNKEELSEIEEYVLPMPGREFYCVHSESVCVYFKDAVAGHTNTVRCKF